VGLACNFLHPEGDLNTVGNLKTEHPKRYELYNGHSPSKTAVLLHSAPCDLSKGTGGGAVFINTPSFSWESAPPGVLASIKVDDNNFPDISPAQRIWSFR